MKFELWDSKEGGLTYLREDENYKKNISLLEPDAEKVWEFTAKSYFEAMQAYYDYMEWGTYTPEPDWQDEIFTTS